MKIPHNFADAPRFLMGIGLACCFMAGCQKAPPAAPAAKKAAPVVKTKAAAVSQTNEYVSVFEDLQPPQARDPFFPDSHRREPAPPPQQASEVRKTAVASELLLKGIVGSASRRSCVINNEILETGEQGLVRVPSGQLRVRCLTIGNDYVVIKVDGEAQSKRLFMDKKNY
ncbi:MAG TPA: hypothetical protein VH595_00210 [Verrucomicrobiae bacterium]|jgi:hypothetical protein|nr:hypothetical protein [Verrucomicrobiae bacterium]